MNKEAAGSEARTRKIVPKKLQSRVLSPLESLEREKQWWYPRGIQNLLNDSILSDPFHLIEGASPKVDIIDKDKEIVLKAEVPGMQGEDIEVLVGDRTLTLRGSHAEEKESEEGEIYRKERREESFSRTLTLPDYVDTEQVQATCKNGLLTITLAKSEQSKKKKIEVK